MPATPTNPGMPRGIRVDEVPGDHFNVLCCGHLTLPVLRGAERASITVTWLPTAARVW